MQGGMWSFNNVNGAKIYIIYIYIEGEIGLISHVYSLDQ